MLAATETAMPGVGLSIPQVVEREATPYLAIKASGAMRDLPQRCACTSCQSPERPINDSKHFQALPAALMFCRAS